MLENYKQDIFNIASELEFNRKALEAFHHQRVNVPVYSKFIEALGIDASKINHYTQIPCMPIEFFKSHRIVEDGATEEVVFSSSGTTGMQTSKHLVLDSALYERSFLKGFEKFYGNIESYCILALLPSYLERGGSSLVYMTDRLIKESKHPYSGFYLDNYEDLVDRLQELNNKGHKVLLLGVSYALLDIAEQYQLNLNNTIVMETGGMKGRRKELVREELHNILCEKLGVETIHSEYGMTELLSQGYSFGAGVFQTPPWMKILIRDTYDPFTYMPENRSGGINVIDLANIHSCSFIETKDLGKVWGENNFTILGRFDNSDIRGCNLMVAD